MSRRKKIKKKIIHISSRDTIPGDTIGSRTRLGKDVIITSPSLTLPSLCGLKGTTPTKKINHNYSWKYIYTPQQMFSTPINLEHERYCKRCLETKDFGLTMLAGIP